MKNLFILLIIFLFSNIALLGQENSNLTKIQRNIYETKELKTPPKVDGVIDESVWDEVEWASDFIQVEPNPGELSSQKTKVKLLYDNDALYVLAIMEEKEEIFTYLSERDDPGNADWFGLLIDAYNQGTNGLGFFVTAAGVQLEAKYNGQNEDFGWNAVWNSAVTNSENQWIVEMKIPYAALRFPTKDDQIWGIHFWRNRRVNRELSSWNEIKPDVDGYINQAGLLKGISNIETPIRLQFFPYITTGINHVPSSEKFIKNLSANFNAGMDVKYGINDAFTLDMTLIPDFSQVVADDFILNLSPFEVRFNENRQFFTEGTELFNKAGLFYSRRIGGTPIGYYDVYNQIADNETVSSNPANSQLLNATKISGRTEGGLGIGVFNAFEASTFATVTNDETGDTYEVKTSPFTNYNIVVLDQDLPGNSSVTLTNTNVSRFDDAYYNANVMGFNSNLVNTNNKYSFRTEFALSQKLGGTFEEPDLGYKAGASFNKISGNFLYTLYYGLESDKYDPNDLGLLFSPNAKVYYAEANYNIYEPFWKVNNFYSGISMVYERLFYPDKFANFGIELYTRTTTKKFHTLVTSFGLEPVETYDFFEPRTYDFETYYLFPKNVSWNAFFSSNYSKPFALDFNWNLRWFDEPNRWAVNFNISPRFRPNGKLLIVPRLNIYKSNNETGYAANYDIEDGVPFGVRDIRRVSPLLELDYVLNNKMVIKSRFRHYWSTSRYEKLGALNEEGTVDFYNPTSSEFENQNVNYHAFSVDIVYRWIFAPGSEMSVVWKNSIVGSDFPLEDRYIRSFNDMIESPISKGLSVRILYFLDYSHLNKLIKKTS